jgi:hypothetical protein
MGTKVKEQLGMEDAVVNDEELEQLLEKRQSLKQGVSDYRKADKDAKTKISTMSDPTPFRVGRFIIARHSVPPRSVSFDVNEGNRISIKVLGEE